MLSRCLHDCQMSDMKLRRGAAASGKSRRRIEKAFRPKISGGLQAALALRLTRFYYYDRAAAKYVYKKHCFFVHFKSCSDYFSCCFISRPSSVTALLFCEGEVICSWKKSLPLVLLQISLNFYWLRWQLFLGLACSIFLVCWGLGEKCVKSDDFHRGQFCNLSRLSIFQAPIFNR